MIQADIVKQAIHRFPNLPVRTIARYILMQSGEYFDGDYEKIRSSVRWHLGKHGKHSKVKELSMNWNVLQNAISQYIIQ